MLGSINVLAKILGVRFAVITAVFGAIMLTTYALGNPDAYKLGAIALYGLLVVVPVIWLAASGRG